MGKFDGYLICTDFDGTFATKGEPVGENLLAVRYFTENGGRFTVATGRTVNFLREKGVHELINAPACLCNGSVVYDYSRNETLRACYLPFSVDDLLDVMEDQMPALDLLHVFAGDDTLTYSDISQIPPEVRNTKALKVLCRYKTAEDADACKAAALARFAPSVCHISKSWSLGVEFNPTNGTKGHSLDFIKSYIPGIHTAVGVGDNDNDRMLLAHADVGAAPENAVETLKAVAQLHLKPCSEGAIADLIRQLEERL